MGTIGGAVGKAIGVVSRDVVGTASVGNGSVAVGSAETAVGTMEVTVATRSGTSGCVVGVAAGIGVPGCAVADGLPPDPPGGEPLPPDGTGVSLDGSSMPEAGGAPSSNPGVALPPPASGAESRAWPPPEAPPFCDCAS